jgi:hypothetical protein
MRYVQQKIFGNYKLSPDIFDNLEKGGKLTSDKNEKEKLFVRLRESKSNFLVSLNPDSNELSFVVTFNYKNRLVGSVFYDPILMFLNQAVVYHENSYRLLNKSETLSRLGEIEIIDSDKFGIFLQLRFSAIIILHTAFDSFINSIIPEGQINYKDTVKSKKELEDGLRFGDKMRLISELKGIDFDLNIKADKIDYDKLLTLNNARKELVHFKTHKAEKNFEVFIDRLQDILRIDLDDLLDTVIRTMNKIKPGFVDIKDETE